MIVSPTTLLPIMSKVDKRIQILIQFKKGLDGWGWGGERNNDTIKSHYSPQLDLNELYSIHRCSYKYINTNYGILVLY